MQQQQTEMRQEVTRLADATDGLNERLGQLDRKLDNRFDKLVTLIKDCLKQL